MSVADERPRRPWAIVLVVCWAVLVAVGTVGAAVVVVMAGRYLELDLDHAKDRFAARGVLFLAMALVGVAMLLVAGARALWRQGRATTIRAVAVAVALIGVFGAVDSLVERSVSSAVVAGAFLVVAAVPWVLLGLPSVREWRDAVFVPRPPTRRSPFAERWGERLSPSVASKVNRVGLSQVGLVFSVMLLVTGLGVVGLDGPVAGGIVAGLGAAGAVASVVVWRGALRDARHLLEVEHGLPVGASRDVEFQDPVVFDATLRRAVRVSGRRPQASDQTA